MEPFLGMLMVVPFNFAPKGWAFCNGQLLAINQNQALFALLGTTFGGDGRVTFALPNMQGRNALHAGPGFSLGQVGGLESVQLSINQMPAHTHAVAASSTAGSVANPSGAVLGESAMYRASPPDPASQAMSSGAVGNAGSNQPHTNRAPYLVLNYVIALQGIFPSQN
jgi:microcystin-dependent protein